MNRQFDTVTIIGVGLLGGSLGQALKSRGMARVVRGVGRRQSSLDTALAVGAIDSAFLDLREATPGADLIVICSPAAHVTSALDSILSVYGPRTIVTDVASTKSQICAHARNTWPKPQRFVGSHPMGGSEKFGPENATPTLFQGCVTMVEAGDHIDAEAREAVCGLWRDIGARVVEMDPQVHDVVAARTSHVPHLMAACVSILAAGELDAHAREVRALIGQGFRDVTRIAESRAETWRDICLTNRDAVLAALDDMLEALSRIRTAVGEGNGDAIEAFFNQGRIARENLIRSSCGRPTEGDISPFEGGRGDVS
jgi:prephenate dehydrogenase